MTFSQAGENVNIALSSIQSQKLRSFLTLLGIVIGVSSVIGVATIIEGLNRDVISRVQALGSKVFFISRMPGGTFGRLPEEIRLRQHFAYDDARVIKEASPHVEYATSFTTRFIFFGDSNEIRYRNEQVTDLILRGVDENYSAAIPMFDVSQGRTISRYDNEHARFVAVLGHAIAASLFPHSDPIGRTVRINGFSFEVIGVFLKDEGLFGGGGVDQFVCIPYWTFNKLYPEIEEHFLAVSVRENEHLPAAVDETVAALRRVRKVPPREEIDFEITLPEFLTRMWNQLTGVLFGLTFAIAGVALLVGGIGVMNIMLISVTERTREIGVRKAMGARRQDIRLQFLIEAMTLTSVGGLIGILAGAGIGWTLEAIFPALPVFVSPFWVILGFCMSAGVGLFFGMYPAHRAAELDPITCLRYE